MLSVLASASLTFFLAVFSPTAQFCSLNQRFYSRKQLLLSLALSFILSLFVFCISFYFFDYLSALPFVELLLSKNIHLLDGTGTLISLLLFFILNERFFDESFNEKAFEKKVKFGLLILLFLISLFLSSLIINCIFLFLLLSSCFDAYKNSKVDKQILFDEKVKNTYYIGTTKTNVKLKHKPNIYLLLLESYHSAEALKELYGIDDTVITEFFKNNNFTDYTNVYSNTHNTNNSLSNILRCRLSSSTSKNTVFALDVLRENGYTCEFFDSQYYVFGEYIQEKEHANFYISKRVRLLYLYLGPIWGQSKYLRKIVNNIDPFDVKVDFTKLFAAFKERISIKRKQPTFYAIRFGAEHANTRESWRKDASFFTNRLYPTYMQQGRFEVSQIIPEIIKNDPHALILAIGDHGALRHGNIYEVNKDLQTALKMTKVSNRELALDLFSVRFAIRWTQAHKTQGQTLSHVNLFPYVFESLGGGEELLENLQPNISVYSRTNSLVVREGEILEKIVPNTDSEYYEKLKELFKNQKANCEECLLLASSLKHAEQVEVLAWAYEHYPQVAEVQTAYFTSLNNFGKVDKALELAEEVLAKNNNKELEVQYFNLLSEIYPQKFLEKRERGKALSENLPFKLAEIRSFIKCDDKIEANKGIDALIQTYTKDRPSFTYAMQALTAIKDYDRILSLASKVQQKEKFLDFYKFTSLAALMQNDWARAEKEAVMAINSWPSHIWTWLILSYIYEKTGKIKEAITVLSKAEQFSPRSNPIRVSIGQLATKYNIQESVFSRYKLLANKEMETVISVFLQTNCIDKNWYKSQLKPEQPIALVHWHYVSEGIFAGLNPTPWFDSVWYLANYSEVWNSGINPFLHYLQEGLEKLYSPSFVHNPKEILLQSPELIEDKMKLLFAMNKTWK